MPNKTAFLVLMLVSRVNKTLKWQNDVDHLHLLQCPSASYHLLHLHLDVRWWSVVLLHFSELTLGPLAPQLPLLVQEPPRPGQGAAEGEAQQSPLQQCMSMVVWDLITLMSRGGSSLKVSGCFLVFYHPYRPFLAVTFILMILGNFSTGRSCI